MKRIVRLRADAESDLRAAMDWYDDQRDGLGDELLADVDATPADVAERPASFPLVAAPFRRALLRRFPYAIYFRETADAVHVFAVFHARRDPNELRKKLSK